MAVELEYKDLDTLAVTSANHRNTRKKSCFAESGKMKMGFDLVFVHAAV
jgi:hypothetical protein